MSTGVILITKNKNKWKDVFNDNLIFDTLTDEHVLRILFLQKIKIAKSLNDKIKIYLDEIELDDFNLTYKLYSILKYKSDDYNIEILDIDNGYNFDEIIEYNNKVEKMKKVSY